MDSMEMKTLQETSRVVEKMADFAGSVILQLMQKQGYVEKQGIKALLDHIREGGGTLTTVVSEQRAEDFKELMKGEHTPYVEIEHVDPNSKEKSIFFVYRDCDKMGVKDVIKQFEIALDQSCHEVDLDTFIKMTDKKSYGTVSNLSKAEVYAFREVAKGYVFNYSVVADGEKYAIVGSDAQALSYAVSDMCYNLSGNLGREYEIALQNYFLQQKALVERMKPEPGQVKYIVNKNNPANFISVDENGITTHSVGRRLERGADGVVRDVAYPKELAERMDAFLEEHLYQNMAPEKKVKLQEEMSIAEGSKTHNKAVNYMLQMEDRDREMLRAGNKHMLDYYNEVQKEAMKRLVEKDVKEQVMNQDREKMLKERMVDKRIDLIR